MTALAACSREEVREGGKVPAEYALEIARLFVRYLRPHTQKIIVAGSLRRRKQYVSDVEIMFVPKFGSERDPSDLFGATRLVSLTDRAIDALLALGVLEKRAKSDGSFTWGSENKLGVNTQSGIAVDLFTATPENWWNYLVCRTGGTQNNLRICQAAIARGWKWNPYGEGFSRTDPRVERHAVTSERDVFEFVGLPYLEPRER